MIFNGKPMELRYVNPLMILHSWFIPNYGNTMINLEVSARPLPGLEIWGQLAIDQIQSAAEEDRAYTSLEPEAMGYLAGAEYLVPLRLDRPAWVSAGTEWVFLDPWMYIGRSVLGSFSYRRRVQAEHVLPAGAKVIVEKSLGYPAGPDFYGITAYGELDVPSLVRARAEAGFYAHGENAIGRTVPADDEADAARVTPSGDSPEYVTALRLNADATVLEAALGSVPVTVEAGFVLDVVRIANNDFVAGATLWDVQFSPYVTVGTAILR
jgi:hypothetical protein